MQLINIFQAIHEELRESIYYFGESGTRAYELSLDEYEDGAICQLI